MTKILVTGGAGFIGSNFIRYWLKRHPADFITNLDLFTYAGNHDILREFKNERRVKTVRGDICDTALVDRLMKNQEAVFHFAAETHVDRSIHDSQIFLKTNILGTHTLLEAARAHKIKRFVFVSTDEVYGSIKKGSFTEKSPIEPNSPYSVSKAAADLLCRSFWVTYKTPVIITRCSNNYGPFQFPEKVIPLFITNLLADQKIPVYGKGLNVREWIYVMDHCSGIEYAYRKGTPGDVYNIGSGEEMSNIELAESILKCFGKSKDHIQFVTDRLGHDLRYSLDSSKLRRLGWKPRYRFKTALEETVEWYRRNADWWKKIRQKTQYKKYIMKQYKKSS